MKTGEKQEKARKPGTFRPGQSGNPKGRPSKGYSITEMMKEMLGSDPEIKKSLGERIIALALKGDIAAIKLVWNYMDGMPKQTIEGGITHTYEKMEKKASSPKEAKMLAEKDDFDE
jgi:hypothetical protein